MKPPRPEAPLPEKLDRSFPAAAAGAEEHFWGGAELVRRELARADEDVSHKAHFKAQQGR